MEGSLTAPEPKPGSSAASTILSIVGALTAVAAVITGVILSGALDPNFKVGAVVITLFLLAMLFLTASGWGGRLYRRFERNRYENGIAEHTELVAELTGFVDIAEKLWGNMGFDGSLTRLHESIIQDMLAGNLLKNATVSPTMYYTWVHHIKVRAGRAAASPYRLRTSEFEELVSEIGSLIGNGGDYVRYYLQNLVNDPGYSPSKAARDAYDVHKELHNTLASDYDRYVTKINSTLRTELGFYLNLLRNLK